MDKSNHTQVRRALFLRSFFGLPGPSELFELLADRMKPRTIKPGEIIYAEGSESDLIYFVTSGDVEMSSKQDISWVLSSPSLLGIFDANTEQVYSRTAKAITLVEANTLSFAEFSMIVEDFFDFSKELILLGIQGVHERALELPTEQILAPPSQWKLPTIEPARLDDVHRIVILRHSTPFELAPIQALAVLAQNAIEKRYTPGEPILVAGQPSQGLHLVAQGYVQIHHHTPMVRGYAGPGDIIPNAMGVSNTPYVFSATAQSSVTVLRILHEDLYNAMEEHFLLTRSWWKFLGRENARIRSENSRGLSYDLMSMPDSEVS